MLQSFCTILPLNPERNHSTKHNPRYVRRLSLEYDEMLFTLIYFTYFISIHKNKNFHFPYLFPTLTSFLYLCIKTPFFTVVIILFTTSTIHNSFSLLSPHACLHYYHLIHFQPVALLLLLLSLSLSLSRR